MAAGVDTAWTLLYPAREVREHAQDTRHVLGSARPDRRRVLIGDFPDTPVPAEPVSVDQRGCIYRPRVVGLRVGQPLIVRNSDDGLHNVHNNFHPRDSGILRIECDVHTWMVAFVGVVNHPYFAVTGKDGSFELHDVPAGTYDDRAWHERLGAITSQVRFRTAVPPSPRSSTRRRPRKSERRK
jgi:hypothetical protein